MVWKKTRDHDYEEKKFLTKRAVETKATPLFMNAKTRAGKTLNQQRNCKITVEKPLTTEKLNAYNHILDEEREINNVREKRKNAVTKK